MLDLRDTMKQLQILTVPDTKKNGRLTSTDIIHKFFWTGVLFPFLFELNILAYLGIFLDADKDNQKVTQEPVQDPLGF